MHGLTDACVYVSDIEREEEKVYKLNKLFLL